MLLNNHIEEINHLLSAFMIIGVFASSINGVLRAIRAKMDIAGAILLSFITANGGGTVRDLLLGTTVFWIKEQFYIWLTLIIGIVSFFIIYKNRHVISSSSVYKFLLITDSMGLAAFSLAGVEKAQSCHQNITISLMMGVWTAVGGGILADIASNEVPIVLTKEIYATIAFLGSLFYFILHNLMNDTLAAIISAVFMIAFRLYSVKIGLKYPTIN